MILEKNRTTTNIVTTNTQNNKIKRTLSFMIADSCVSFLSYFVL